MNHLNSHHKKMKKTFRVNIGKRPFIIDEDAYETLKEYLDQISIRLNADESTEIMDDIENRIADLFQEKLSSRVQVVDINAVNRVIAIIGNAKEFGDPIRTNENHNTTETTMNDDTIMDHLFLPPDGCSAIDTTVSSAEYVPVSATTTILKPVGYAYSRSFCCFLQEAS